MITEKKRFFLYMLFAWGFALLFTIIVITVDSSPSIPEHFKPRIGVDSGFLKGKIIVALRQYPDRFSLTKKKIIIYYFR